ncbi:MAG: hypothetical protein ACXWTY_16525 [Methylobacter sp.]
MAALAHQVLEAINLGRLKSLGVLSPECLPFLLPRNYMDLRQDQLVTDFTYLALDAKYILSGLLSDDIQINRQSRPCRLSIKISDPFGHIVLATFFGDPRSLLQELNSRKGTPICLTGMVDTWKGDWQVKSPSLLDNRLIGRVAPCYPGKPNVISPETVGKHMDELLPVLVPVAASWLRDKLAWSRDTERERLSVLPSLMPNPCIENLLQIIHSPPTPRDGVYAGRLLRLIATMDVLAGARAESVRKEAAGSAITIPPQILDRLLSETDLVPTEEQRQVIDDICRDITLDRPMLRLLSADVGFGKTFIAGVAGAAIVRSGGTVVWLSPNQPLAFQTRNNIAGWWPDLEPGLWLAIQPECRKPNSQSEPQHYYTGYRPVFTRRCW